MKPPRRQDAKKKHWIFALVVLLSVLRAFAVAQAGSISEPIQFTIDATADVKPISRFIYGVNHPIDRDYPNITLTRLGGNRWSAYNWTNNASNAGNDWHYQNDNFLGGGDLPGGAMIPGIENARRNSAAIILTVPMVGYVSADKKGDGDPRGDPDYLSKRFRPEQPFKNAPFTLTPDLNSPVIYQDEFVNWVQIRYPYGSTDAKSPIWFMLDNEPSLWSQTHAEVHAEKTTYAELIDKSIQYAMAVKHIDPNTLVFGPANYGWHAFVNLQGAPDAGGRDFQEVYLRAMKDAGTKAGRRLLDVFDVHWYPSVRVRKIRITEKDSSPDVAAARVQDTRSLWDPTYVENSWITKNGSGPIDLIHRLLGKINRNYPGTRLSISEYNFGGWDEISGAIAEADCLGIFGHEGVFAACEWPLADHEPFIAAAFRMFRDFDGQDGAFGDTSIRATTNDPADTSIYASLQSDRPGEMILVAINKSTRPLATEFNLSNAKTYTRMEIFSLTSAGKMPQPVSDTKIANSNKLQIELPPDSVSTIRLTIKN